MLNLKNIFAATALLVATSSASAIEIELDNFEYQGPNSVFLGVDGDNLTGDNLRFASQFNGTPEAGVVVEATNALFTANVEFSLSVDADDGGFGDPASPLDGSSVSTVANVISSSDSSPILAFSEDVGIDAQLEIIYSDSAGGVFDLTTFDAFYVDVLNAFEGLDLILALEDSLGEVGELEFISNEETATGERIVFNFTSLADEIDLSTIASISATIDSDGVSADLTLTSIGLIRVPEPAALAIIGLVLLGFGVRRRNL